MQFEIPYIRLVVSRDKMTSPGVTVLATDRPVLEAMYGPEAVEQVPLDPSAGGKLSRVIDPEAEYHRLDARYGENTETGQRWMQVAFGNARVFASTVRDMLEEGIDQMLVEGAGAALGRDATNVVTEKAVSQAEVDQLLAQERKRLGARLADEKAQADQEKADLMARIERLEAALAAAGGHIRLRAVADMTKDQLAAELEERGVEFSAAAKKDALATLLSQVREAAGEAAE